jgi:hypothetical protein
MNSYVACAKCGKRNEASRLFCTGCGAKLDLSNVRINKGGGLSVGRLVARTVRMALFLGLLAVLGLLVWPSQPTGMAGTVEDGRVLYDKLRDLDRALRTSVTVRQIIPEKEINGYFAYLLAERAAPSAGAGQLDTQDIRIHLTPGEATVHIKAKLSFLTLTYEITGQPSLENRRFLFNAQRVKMGHLPLPGFIGDRLETRVAAVFRNLKQEREILDDLAFMAIEENRVRVATP